jgi:membrane protease YdiL (CAAX protease family)
LKPGRKLSDFDIGPFRLKDIFFALVALGGIYICIIPIGYISMLLVPELDNLAVYGSGWQFENLKLLPLVFISCLVTGYCEELFFRSYLYTSLRNAGTAAVTAVIITSVLFGAGHFYEGYYAFAATAAIGGFLSIMFIKTKSIHAIAIGHGLYNFSVLLIAMTGEI